MTQVPMLPPGMIQEPAKLVKGCPSWLHARHNSGPHLAQEIILVPSQPALTGMTHVFVLMDSSTGKSHQNGLRTQIPWIWCQKDADTPQRCPREEKRHCPPGCLKLMQTPPRWHKEASDPSGMAKGRCRSFWDGVLIMQTPPVWYMEDAHPTRMEKDD